MSCRWPDLAQRYGQQTAAEDPHQSPAIKLTFRSEALSIFQPCCQCWVPILLDQGTAACQKCLTFCRELDARIKDFASGLRSLGLAKGDKVKHKVYTNSLSIVSAAPCSTWRLPIGLLHLPQRCNFLELVSKLLSSTAATVHCLLRETASSMFHSHPSSIWTPATVLLLVAVKLLQYKHSKAVPQTSIAHSTRCPSSQRTPLVGWWQIKPSCCVGLQMPSEAQAVPLLSLPTSSTSLTAQVGQLCIIVQTNGIAYSLTAQIILACITVQT